MANAEITVITEFDEEMLEFALHKMVKGATREEADAAIARLYDLAGKDIAGYEAAWDAKQAQNYVMEIPADWRG